MTEDLYTRLREFMNKLPAGFPSTPTGVEIKILKKLFSPEEAELVMKLNMQPEEASSIADRLGIDKTVLAETLEAMAQKGLIFRIRTEDTRLYMPYQFLIGVYEFQLNRLDKEFAELFEEYLPYVGLSLASVKTKQSRIIPIESSVGVSTEVAPYNRIRELIKQQDLISLQPCICRKEQGLLGNECDRPHDVCMGFGLGAQYYIDNNMGRQIGVDEALNVLDLAEESGLVLTPSNSQNIGGLCCCCPCCCPNLKYSKLMDRPADQMLTYFEAKIDSENCSACGACAERCQMDAIKENEDTSEIIDGRCIGCGLCVAGCPEEAITMVVKPDVTPPPNEFIETLIQIGTERGVF